MDEQQFEYDVFLSHSSEDKPAVRELAERLQGDGLKVWLDEWVIQPGDHWPSRLEQGLEKSRTLVLVMSRSAFASEWVTMERHTALFRDPTNQQRRFIPLRLDDCEIKDSLRQFAYVDWRDKTDAAYSSILNTCSTRDIHDTKGSVVDDKRMPVVTLSRHSKTIRQLSVMNDGNQVVSAGDDRIMRVGEIGTKAITHTINDFFANALAVTSDGLYVVSGHGDGYIRAWSVESGECIEEFANHGRLITSLALTPDGRFVLTGDMGGVIRKWELNSSECVSTLFGHTAMVPDLAVSSDGRFLISCSSDGTIRRWNLDSDSCEKTVLVGSRKKRVAV